MNLEEFYARIGGSYADTVRRLCNDALVTRFVMKYPANPSFDELCAALDASDWATALFIRSRVLRRISALTGSTPPASR